MTTPEAVGNGEEENEKKKKSERERERKHTHQEFQVFVGKTRGGRELLGFTKRENKEKPGRKDISVMSREDQRDPLMNSSHRSSNYSVDQSFLPACQLPTHSQDSAPSWHSRFSCNFLKASS